MCACERGLSDMIAITKLAPNTTTNSNMMGALTHNGQTNSLPYNNSSAATNGELYICHSGQIETQKHKHIQLIYTSYLVFNEMTIYNTIEYDQQSK